METYTIEDVAKIINRSYSTASRIILNIKKEYCKKNKIDVKNMGSGRSSKVLFHKYYPNE